ncbi:helix-turn-helix transcriptional regulator [bacterium]|jgi:DNA-binding CsgD family transcriptional regulator|nr:helix-turn-helix transcriptional regulator [bacterium]
MGLISFVKNLINCGVEFTNSYEDSQRVRLTNTLSLVFIGLSIPYSLFFIAIKSTFMGMMVVPCITLFALPILLNIKNKQDYVGLSFVLSVSVTIYFYASVFGRDAGIQFMLFPLLASSSIMFSSDQKKHRISAVLIIFCTYLILELSDFNFFIKSVHSIEVLRFIRLSIIFNLICILIFIVEFQFKITSHSKMTLAQFVKRFNITQRESEIVTHVCKGASNKEIAEILFIEAGTVKVHLKNIYRKLDVKNRTELVASFYKPQ